MGINQNYISSATHTPSSYGGTVNVGGRYVDNVSSEFHIYRLEWSETRLIFSVGNQVHYIYEPSVQNMETWPFDLNQYILLNVAVLPDIIATGFTQDAMEIDYVRVYQNNLSTDDSQSDSFRIYPNPAVSELNILGEGDFSYQISDMSGKILLQGEVNESDKIRIADLNAGVYNITCITENKIQTLRFIKQ